VPTGALLFYCSAITQKHMADMRTVTFKWDEDTYEEFRQAFVQLQAQGEIPTDMTRSEAIRAILEDWMENPDAEILHGE